MLSALKSFGPRCFWLPTSWQGRRARYGGGGGLSQVFGLTPGEEAFAGARGGLFGRGAFLVFMPAQYAGGPAHKVRVILVCGASGVKN